MDLVEMFFLMLNCWIIVNIKYIVGMEGVIDGYNYYKL